MSNKNQNQSKPAAAPAPAAAAPAPAPAADQSNEPQVGAGPDAPVTDAGASNEATPEQVTGGSGAMVASTTDKVGTKTPVADVVAQKQEQAAAAAPTGPWSSEAQAYIDGLKSTSAKNGFDELAIYLVEMAPGKPVDSQRMAAYQVSLWRTIQLLLNQSGEEFPVVFGVLLKIFDEHSQGALGGTYVFRGAEDIVLRDDDQKAFRQILNMLVHMADPKSRSQKHKVIDFSRTLSYGVTEQARTGILAFFNK